MAESTWRIKRSEGRMMFSKADTGRRLAGTPGGTFSTRPALVGLALAMLLASLGTSIANVALPTLAGAFSAPFRDVQWVVIAYLLAVTVAVVGVGRIGDVIGRRRVLLAGIALFSVASILCALAPTLRSLIVARALQGLGAATLMALALALVRETVPKEAIGRAMGLLGTVSAIGTALGPSLGGLLLAGLGWRTIFLIMVPLGAVSFVVLQRYLPIHEGGARIEWGEFDVPGTLLLGLTLASYALGVTVGDGLTHGLAIVLLSSAGLGACLFLFVESRAAFPLVPPAALRGGAVGAGLAMNAIVATVMMSTLVVGPFYLARALGLGEALVGVVMSVGPIVSTVCGIPAGRCVDRAGTSSILLIGLVAMVAGALAMMTLPVMFGVVGYVAAIAVLTPGYQLFQAANNTVVVTNTPPERQGVTSGLLGLSRNLGLVTGASAMGSVFAIASAAGDITTASAEAVAEGMRVTFGVAAILLVIALGIAIGCRPGSTRRTHRAKPEIPPPSSIESRGKETRTRSVTAGDPDRREDGSIEGSNLC